MAIEIVNGKVNISGTLKEKGAKLQMNEAEEKRLVNLGIAKYIDEGEEIEVIEDPKTDTAPPQKGGK